MRDSTIALIALALTIVAGFRYSPISAAISPHTTQLTAAMDRITGSVEATVVQTTALVTRSGQMITSTVSHHYDESNAVLASAFEHVWNGVRTSVVKPEPVVCAVTMQVGDGSGDTTFVASISINTDEIGAENPAQAPVVTSVLRSAYNLFVRPVVKLGRGFGTVVRGVFGKNEESAPSEYGNTSNVSTIGG
jgi:hypothetical protein